MIRSTCARARAFLHHPIMVNDGVAGSSAGAGKMRRWFPELAPETKIGFGLGGPAYSPTPRRMCPFAAPTLYAVESTWANGLTSKRLPAPPRAAPLHFL